MDEEYRLKVTVKNNLILSAIENMGYTNLSKFCKDGYMSLAKLYDLINLRMAPINADGEFTKIAKNLMEVLGACPSDLWTEEQLTLKLRSNHVTKNLSKERVEAYLSSGNSRLVLENPANRVEKEDEVKIVNDIVDSLTPREAKILRLRYGLDGSEEQSLSEVGSHYDITQERVRQLEARALRKMRHPSRSDILKDILYKDEGEDDVQNI